MLKGQDLLDYLCRKEELLAPAVNASPRPERGGLLLGRCQQRKAAVVHAGGAERMQKMGEVET